MTIKSYRSGFTLIELLVVIAIIAILAAILFPVLARAKTRSQQASCQSNQRQIHTAVMMYVESHDGILPANYHTTWDGDIGIHTFLTDINPYLKNWQVVSCPSRPTVRCPRWDGRSGYVMLCEVFNYIPGAAEVMPTPYNIIKYTTRTVLLMDAAVLPTGYWGDWQEYPWGTCDFRGYPAWVARMLNGKDRQYLWYKDLMCRHNGGANCMFADGHVRWYKSGSFQSSMFTKDAQEDKWTGARW